MSYQINLLLEDERRSGAHLSRKFLIRMAIGVALGLLTLGVGTIVLSAQFKQTQLKTLKDYFAVLDKTFKSVQKMEIEKKNIEQIAADAEGWRVSRVEWGLLLTNLSAMVPADMQLTQFVLNERLDSSPARHATLVLSGKVGGDFPERDVNTLRENLRNDHGFQTLLSGVDVKRYEVDTTPGSDLKTFMIECKFKARPIQPQQ